MFAKHTLHLMYVIKISVSVIDDCDTCLAKATVIDGTIETVGQHGDLTISLVEKLALLSFEDSIKENSVIKKVQENMLFEEVQTVQFFNFELWGKHEIGKISVVLHVQERQLNGFHY